MKIVSTSGRMMRRKDNPSITQVTIRNETATIGKIFDFAHRNKLSHFPKMYFRQKYASLVLMWVRETPLQLRNTRNGKVPANLHQ